MACSRTAGQDKGTGWQWEIARENEVTARSSLSYENDARAGAFLMVKVLMWLASC